MNESREVLGMRTGIWHLPMGTFGDDIAGVVDGRRPLGEYLIYSTSGVSSATYGSLSQVLVGLASLPGAHKKPPYPGQPPGTDDDCG